MLDRALESVPPGPASTVLLLVGIGLLVNPLVPGVHLGDGTVHRYEAARVTYDDTAGLQVVDASTGEAVHGIDVDDDVVCERAVGLSRTCVFEAAVRGGADVPAPPGDRSESRYVYVYLDDAFYEPTVEDRANGSYAALERVTDADPLARVAREGDLPAPVRRAIARERVIVYGDLPLENTLVRHDGAYYTVYTSGAKRYGSRGSFCASNGEGFCSDADAKRWVDTLLTLGSRLLGGVLLVGGYRLHEAG